jgi:hypothetical protein
LEAAARDYRRREDSEWFPKPGQIRALASRHALIAVKALGIARMAAKQPIRRTIESVQPTIPTVRGMP